MRTAWHDASDPSPAGHPAPPSDFLSARYPETLARYATVYLSSAWYDASDPRIVVGNMTVV